MATKRMDTTSRGTRAPTSDTPAHWRAASVIADSARQTTTASASDGARTVSNWRTRVQATGVADTVSTWRSPRPAASDATAKLDWRTRVQGAPSATSADSASTWRHAASDAPAGAGTGAGADADNWRTNSVAADDEGEWETQKIKGSYVDHSAETTDRRPVRRRPQTERLQTRRQDKSHMPHVEIDPELRPEALKFFVATTLKNCFCNETKMIDMDSVTRAMIEKIETIVPPVRKRRAGCGPDVNDSGSTIKVVHKNEHVARLIEVICTYHLWEVIRSEYIYKLVGNMQEGDGYPALHHVNWSGTVKFPVDELIRTPADAVETVKVLYELGYTPIQQNKAKGENAIVSLQNALAKKYATPEVYDALYEAYTVNIPPNIASKCSANVLNILADANLHVLRTKITWLLSAAPMDFIGELIGICLATNRSAKISGFYATIHSTIELVKKAIERGPNDGSEKGTMVLGVQKIAEGGHSTGVSAFVETGEFVEYFEKYPWPGARFMPRFTSMLYDSVISFDTSRLHERHAPVVLGSLIGEIGTSDQVVDYILKCFDELESGDVSKMDKMDYIVTCLAHTKHMPNQEILDKLQAHVGSCGTAVKFALSDILSARFGGVKCEMDKINCLLSPSEARVSSLPVVSLDPEEFEVNDKYVDDMGFFKNLILLNSSASQSTNGSYVPVCVDKFARDLSRYMLEKVPKDAFDGVIQSLIIKACDICKTDERIEAFKLVCSGLIGSGIINGTFFNSVMTRLHESRDAAVKFITNFLEIPRADVEARFDKTVIVPASVVPASVVPASVAPASVAVRRGKGQHRRSREKATPGQREWMH